MEYPVVILLHVFTGILWAGAGIVAGFFILPAALDSGPGGGLVMANAQKRKLTPYLVSLGIIVILTGSRLYMFKVGAATSAWITTKEGLGISLGALLAIGALTIGLTVQRPTVERIGALSEQIRTSGGPPTSAQTAELEKLRAKLRRTAAITAWHLLGAALLMASHRLLSVL